MKMMSINNFITKILSKLLSDLSIGIYLKGTKKFGSKIINVQLFHKKNVCLHIINSNKKNFLVSNTTF